MCDIRALLKSSYRPLNVYVSKPLPLRHKWSLIGGSDIKQLPHHGAFDKEKASHVKSPPSDWQLHGAVLGDLTQSIFPTVGYLTLGHVEYPL